MVTPMLARARWLLDAGRHDEALTAFREHLARDPGCADGWYELGWLLRRTGAAEAALTAYARALALGIAQPEQIHLNRAVILSEDLHDAPGAARELAEALRKRADYPPALLNLGKLHEDSGDLAAARRHYARLASLPDGAIVLEGLARLVLLDAADPAQPERIERLRRAASQPGHPADLRATLYFAIGHCEEASDHPREAFAAFAEANRLCASTGPAYSPERMEAHVGRILSADPDSWPELPVLPDASPRPLFVCGMFRSGSTLLEQVLHAHPAIVALGELRWLPALAASCPAASAGEALSIEQASELREQYLARRQPLLTGTARSVRYATDKRPDNVLLLPLIRQLFPQAPIVITQRHPLDTGLSVYQQHLRQSIVPYASDLAAIGHFQAQVRRIARWAVARWPSSVRIFDYDAFVRDPKRELEPLLAWLGLPWDPCCLSFHELRNPVATASHQQVRQPLYRTSCGRWRRHAECLEPMRRALLDSGFPAEEIDP